MSARIDLLGYVRRPEDADYLNIEWDRKLKRITLTSEANRIDLDIEDIDWVRDVFFQINYELKREE